ncbi:MAG: pyridoxal-phosphate dependent enzyme [Desulfobacterales bacterium]|nr:pyridoxal-phosphate dependent enzyme [Desulfobacterales bacterium]
MTDWSLTCPSCPQPYAIGDGLFGCPAAGNGAEHILRRVLAAGSPTAGEVRASWGRGGGTFERLSPLISSRRLAGAAGYERILERVAAELARHEGRGFEVTPLTAAPALAAAIGRSGPLWVKDETGNVTGSHKGRHLMGTLLYLEALRCLDPTRTPRALAIYSCGNAAIAAAAVARVGGYELHAFVPADVDPVVDRMLAERGAIVEKIPRDATGEGDPCYLAFRSALAEHGWLPFACAGNDNWSNIEGGATLGWEIVLQLAERGEEVDHVVIQVGGGALARAAAQALEEAHGLGLIPRLPRIHVCQPEGGFPFVRAWLLALAEIARRSGQSFDLNYDRGADPSAQLQGALAFCRTRGDQIREIVEYACRSFDSSVVQSVLTRMAGEAGHFMWPWDGPAPQSLAHGILDDVTYDWYHLLRTVLRTGGRAEILDDGTIGRAHGLAQRHTGIRVCTTGAAGLAGLIRLTATGAIDPGARSAVLFTGFDRS